MVCVLGNVVLYNVDKCGVFIILRIFFIDINNNKCLLGFLFYFISRNKKVYINVLWLYIVYFMVFFIFVIFCVYRNSLKLYGLINY